MAANRLTIRTGLSGFLLLKAIIRADSEKIMAMTGFSDVQGFEVIEALAQTGAMHVRFLCGFDCHAFLLKINRFACSASGQTCGNLELQADLMVRTQSAFTYQVSAAANGKQLASGEFSFAVEPYGDRFKQGELQARYRRIFSCLSGLNSESGNG